MLEEAGGFDVGLARGQDVRVQERLPQPDKRVGQGARVDEGDQAELLDVAVQEVLDEGHDPGLHPAARVGQHPQGQRRLVVEQPSQARGLGHDRVDVAAGTRGVQLAGRAFGLPARRGGLQGALGQQPQRLAEQFLAAADPAEQRHPRHAQLIGQALHVQAPALIDPPGRYGHDAFPGGPGPLAAPGPHDAPRLGRCLQHAVEHTVNDNSCGRFEGVTGNPLPGVTLTESVTLRATRRAVGVPASEYVDVLIVGAGLSGIGAACHLQALAPGRSFAIVEARAASGGTWDLFRFPGIRSDSDMFTLGYPFRPWTASNAIAGGGQILRYLRETAAAHGVDQHISYHSRVVRADWSGTDAQWTVTVEDTATGARTERRCGFLYLCAGYYRYDQGYTPDWPGRDSFAGRIVHPQHWPEDLDLTGQRVAVIGSGATAVTLVPAIAAQAAKVTMVQRSPSYVMALPAKDPIDGLLRAVLPRRRVYAAIRWKNARIATYLYQLCRRRPDRARAMLTRGVRKRLPTGYDVATHFTPAYNPWDQRMCLTPDGDFFDALSSGKAEIVTDHIEAFTPAGLRLRSGALVEADVIVTATGLNLRLFGGIELIVDGEPVNPADRIGYKAMMLEGVPNMAFAVGYTNASWTLKVDLVSAYVARIVACMAAGGYRAVTPRRPAGPMHTAPFIEMSSGYFQRARDLLPLQGDRAPWRVQQHYFKDAALYRGPVDTENLEFTRAPAVAGR